jgi:hypothetical protein
MSEFCLDGYETTRNGIATAAQRWFAEQFETLKKTTASESEAKPQDPIEQAVRAFSWPQVPEEWRQIATQTVHRLRNLLHQGKLNAYYFDNDGRHSVLRDFWATAQAGGVLESGLYWPFGRPSRDFEMRPSYPLFLREAELDSLLSEQPADRRHLPRSEIPNLVQALGQRFRGSNHIRRPRQACRTKCG